MSTYNNPVIRKQLVGQLELLEASAEKDKRTQMEIAKMKKAIANIDKGAADEKAAAAHKVAHDEAAAKKKEDRWAKKQAGKESMSLYHDKEIMCKDCSYPFYFSARQQEKFIERQLSEPTRCDECREYRKQFQHMVLNCTECSKDFNFGIGAQMHYVEQGYDPPSLCHDCRAAKKKVIPPEMITCKECNTDFKFTYGEQMFFKEQGWEDPRRCIPCRKIHKTEFAEKMAARMAAKRAKPAPPSAPSEAPTVALDPVAMDLIASARAMVNGDGTWNVA